MWLTNEDIIEAIKTNKKHFFMKTVYRIEEKKLSVSFTRKADS